jgi:hypothetical protein
MNRGWRYREEDIAERQVVRDKRGGEMKAVTREQVYEALQRMRADRPFDLDVESGAPIPIAEALCSPDNLLEGYDYLEVVPFVIEWQGMVYNQKIEALINGD